MDMIGRIRRLHVRVKLLEREIAPQDGGGQDIRRQIILKVEQRLPFRVTRDRQAQDGSNLVLDHVGVVRKSAVTLRVVDDHALAGAHGDSDAESGRRETEEGSDVRSTRVDSPVIISGGSNIYPREVEDALLEHPPCEKRP